MCGSDRLAFPDQRESLCQSFLTLGPDALLDFSGFLSESFARYTLAFFYVLNDVVSAEHLTHALARNAELVADILRCQSGVIVIGNGLIALHNCEFFCHASFVVFFFCECRRL